MALKDKILLFQFNICNEGLVILKSWDEAVEHNNLSLYNLVKGLLAS